MRHKFSFSRVFFILLLFSVVATLTANPFSNIRGGHKHAANYSKPEGYNFEEIELADGVYSGSATGFRDGLEVEVTVENGEVTNIEVISHNEVGPQYYSTPIKYIPGEIVSEKNSEVDAVAGATATSSGIMCAVEDALSKAII